MKRGRLSYLVYFLRNAPRVIAYRLFRIAPRRKRFLGAALSKEITNESLKKALSDGTPFAAVRIGCVELSALNNHEKIELGFKKGYKESVRFSIRNNAGYYPTTEEALKRYGDELLPLLGQADCLGVMQAHMEDYFARYYAPHAQYVLYEGMEPLHGDWTRALEGKKVLVVSSFPKDISRQYAKRDLLFPSPSPLPSMHLMTLHAPVTFADATPEEGSFFDELSRVEAEMDALDYDVLLVGAGAYGSFLALHAKARGKIGIQTGGATPTLFGIIGKRWVKREHVAKYVNEHWIHPSEKPNGFEKIEQGAYW